MSRKSTVHAAIQATPFLLSGLSAAILAVFVPAAFAAEKKFETVYVSATRSETAQMPVATQIKVISAEDIRVGGAKLLSEVLRTQAGIQLTDSDGSGARNVTASMRGLSGANNVLVLVDGRKLNNPSLAAPALNTVSLKDVERIEIVQGSAGVLYGDQAVGGVINIITHCAVAGEVDGSISATSGTDNLEDYTASVRQGFENGLSYSLSAQKRNADNYRDNNQSAYENVLGNLRYDFAKGFVFVEGQTIDDELNLAGELLEDDYLFDPRAASSPNNYANQYTDLARIGGGIDLGEHWQLLAEFASRDEDTEFYYGAGSPTLGNMQVDNLTPRIVGTIPTRKGDAIVTFGYDQTDAEYTVRDWGTDIEQAIDAFYAQIVYPLTQALSVTTGVRTSSVEDTNHATNTYHEDDLSLGELGLNYQLDNNWRLFGRYADGFRFANANENGLVLPGVDFLEVQTSESYEVGAAWATDRAYSSYSFYHMVLNDEITFDAIAYANINLPDTERQGFQFDGGLTLSNEISLTANYTYTDAEVTSGAFKGKDVPYVSEHTVNLGMVFRPLDVLTVVLDTTYMGSRYLSGDENNIYAKVEPTQLFNVNVIWQIKQLEISGRIKNITNERYSGLQGYSSWQAAKYYYPQPERNYEASITYRF
ncbi:MAG TPA: hypothetical protein DIW64_13660 [Cellvibrio sp.]|nr:hypothetical protein [Cellvibrio sp.]